MQFLDLSFLLSAFLIELVTSSWQHWYWCDITQNIPAELLFFVTGLRIERVDSVPQNTSSRSSSAYRQFESQLWSVHSRLWLAQCIQHLCNVGYGTDASSHFARWQMQVGTVSSECCLGATGSGRHQQERLGGIEPSSNSV